MQVQIPSIGEIISSIPKAAVIGLAALSGISNTTAAPSPARYTGGLQTEPNALWENNGAVQMRACLSSPTAHRFDPDRSVIDCLLQAAASWKDDSNDPYAATILSRGVHRYGLDELPPASSSEEVTPHVPRKALHNAMVAVRTSEKYLRDMANVEFYFSLYTTTRNSDASNSGQPSTGDDLKQRLDGSPNLPLFKEKARFMSHTINEMMAHEGKNIFMLKPELMPSHSDRAGFKMEVDKYYIGTPDADLDDRQFMTILMRLASFMNKRPSLG